MAGSFPRFHVPRATAFALALVPLLAGPASAGPAYLGSRHEIRLTLPRVETAPRVDGVLDDSVWARAAVLDSFVQAEPVEGLPDTLGTRCLVLYDGRELHVGFRCADRPGAVRAPRVPRDRADEGDFVAVALDTYHDFQRALVFGASPRGVQIDGVDTDAQGFDTAPDFQYRAEARLDSTGWSVEIAVPFRSLRFPERDTVSFGFNAARYVARDDATLFWAPITQDVSSSHAQQGALEGLTGIRPGRSLQLAPGFTAQRLGTREDGALRFDDPVTRLSLDGKTALGTSFTLDATVNPDFSQVEADAGVVDVNRRFAIQYEEKRPFFLEGSDLFSTPIDAVYTRRIADPRYGVKLTGRRDDVAIGALHALDRSGGESVETLPDAVNPYFERDAVFDLVRARRDFGAGRSLGVLLGHREQRETYNRGAGIDGRWTWADHWSASTQWVGSASRDRDYRDAFARLTAVEAAPVDSSLLAHAGARHTGHAWSFRMERETRALEAGGFVEDYSPRFAADMGFIPRTDFVGAGAWFEPHFFANGHAWFTGIHPELFVHRVWDHGEGRWAGPRTDENLEASVRAELPRDTEFGFELSRRYTRFEGREFDGHVRVELRASTGRWSAVRLEGALSTGDAVIFEEALDGRSTEYELEAEVRPRPALKLELSLAGSAITRRASGTRFADAVIPRLKVGYQFTRELSLRAIAELEAERRFDTAGIVEEDERGVLLDLLAGYQLRPGSVAYLGYGAGLEGPTVSAAHPRTSNLFLKLSWLWQE